MAKKDTEITPEKSAGLTRRDFFKVAAAAGATGALAGTIDWVATAPNPAMAGVVTNDYDVITTCPYCSVGCNMKVGKDADGNVVDIIGDPDCPINNGALCSKGAASIQLVNNNRRVGVADSIHEASRTYGPMKRTGNGAWEAVTWDNALTEISGAMLSAREDTAGWITDNKVTKQARGVAFLGCSHATNEENWLYRKMIANFGTNNTEHQARI
jgi:formate dehydrogenase major subunit